MSTGEPAGPPKIKTIPASGFPLPDPIQFLEPTTLPDGLKVPTIQPFDIEKLCPYLTKSGK